MSSNVISMAGLEKYRYDVKRLKQWRQRIEDLTPAMASDRGAVAVTQIHAAIFDLIREFESDNATPKGER